MAKTIRISPKCVNSFDKIMKKVIRYTMLIIGIVISLYGGLNDIEPITIIGVLLAVIAVMYNLILKAFKRAVSRPL